MIYFGYRLNFIFEVLIKFKGDRSWSWISVSDFKNLQFQPEFVWISGE